MKKVFWWILGLLLSPVLLFVILAVLLYLPPVQNWAVDKVAAVASEKTGWQITVGHVRLSFPLDLVIEEFRVIGDPTPAPPLGGEGSENANALPSGQNIIVSGQNTIASGQDVIASGHNTVVSGRDTIADVRRMVVDVQLLPLFRQRVVINQLEVTDTRLDTDGLVAAARVKGHFGRLSLTSRGIDLDRQTVEVNGARLEDGRFDIALRDSVPEDTTTSETPWKIHFDSVAVSRTDVALHLPGDTMSVGAHLGALTARAGQLDLGSQTYAVGSVDWLQGRLCYDQNFQPRLPGLDFNHIDLSDISLGVDSIYYHDPTMRLRVRNLALKEKSGLQLTHLTGPVALEDGTLHLPKLRLQTAESDVDVALDLPLNLMDADGADRLSLRLNAQLGRQDLLPFLSSLPQGLRDRWPYYPLQVQGVAHGNMQLLEFSDLSLSLPTAFHATLSGYAANLTDADRLRADVQFSAETQDVGFLMASLPRDVQRNYRIPSGLQLSGNVRADASRYTADVTAREGRGQLALTGSFDSRLLRYDADVQAKELNLHHFMPRDSLYTLTASLKAHGQGTDFFSRQTFLHADADISHLGYGPWALDHMTAQADVSNGRAQLSVVSHNDLLRGTVSADALLSTRKVDATVAADISQLSLYGLRLTDSPFTVGLCGHIDVTSDTRLTHHVNGTISDLTLRDSAGVYRPKDIALLVDTRTDTTSARIQSGDFSVRLDASGSYERLLSQLTTLADSAVAQYRQRVIDQPALRRLLPVMRLHVESQGDNPLAALLKQTQDVGFKDLFVDLRTSPADGVNGNGYLHSLLYGGVRLDTIGFRLSQRAEQLSFGAQVRNNKKNPQFVFNALLDGVLQERGATAGVRFYDAAGTLGVRLGAQAEMVDSGLSIHLMPERPLLGFKEFSLNKDNFIFLGANNKVQARIDLIADDGTGVKVYSEDNDPTALQDLTVSLNRFSLDELTSVLPYVPHMTGLLNGDYHVVQDAAGQLSVVSDMGVQDMTYENSPIGNVSTELVYLQKDDNSHVIDAHLMKDDQEIGQFVGTYYHQGEGSIDARLLLERLPLSLVNGFIPNQLFGLHGYGEGELSVKGTVARPVVDGEIYLDSSYVESVPYGVTLRFDDDPVRIVGSQLLLENFTVYAHNENPLNVMGSIDFSVLDDVQVNLRMQAQNYQLIGARENAKSVAYGKAFVNVFAAMNGPLDHLLMRGKIDVLGSTDMSYVLRDSPLTTDNQLDELVRFTDFSDTTLTVVERPELTGFTMDMTVEVSKGAHIMAYLNADHSNYIDLMGGGSLRMQYSPADNLQLRGKYTLSNGEMKYSLPVIPLKTFTIQDGSYIEFTGDPMNPTLNISATERTRATVSNAGGVGRSVEFDCGVNITRTLNNMGLEFTLDAPEDMQLHSELQAMSVEQRGKLAVSMLTTGMYLADGNTNAFSMNSALSSFLNSEINQITGNALRTLDLSFGMDNSTDATGSSHTDYSFKFAKRFLNNRLKIAVGGKVSTGSELQQRNNSFFDNVSLEYRLDNTANKYVTLFYQNNAYDWLDGYTQKYGGGFTWRRTIQNFMDIFRLTDTPQATPALRPAAPRRDSVQTASPPANDNQH